MEAASRQSMPLKEGIEFRNVSFAYERQKNGHSALEGINFTLSRRSLGWVGWARRLREKHSGAIGATMFDVFDRRRF